MFHLLSTTKLPGYHFSVSSRHSALEAVSCCLVHTAFFIAGQYYLTRFRLNLNIPFSWKTPTPSTFKSCKHKQCSFHAKMYPKGKYREKEEHKAVITEKNTLLFQLRFYVRVRMNEAKRRKVHLLTASSVAKKIFTSAMVKLADLNIVRKAVKRGRVQCSSRMAKYNESKWEVRAETGGDLLKEPNMETQV